MFEMLGRVVEGLIESVLPLYRSTEFAYEIAGAMALCAVLLVFGAVVRHAVMARALTGRTRAISGYISFAPSEAGKGANPREAQFIARFDEIDRAMKRSGVSGKSLGAAWDRFARTLIFDAAPPVQASQHPSTYIYGAAPPPTWLGFAAGLFVAVGLLATFLGLVAALTFATDGLTSNEPAVTQQALVDLLASAASKFITSVAGVGLSIVLRLAERLLTLDLRTRVENLSDALEAGIRVDPDAHSAALAGRISGAASVAESPRNSSVHHDGPGAT